MNKAFGRISGKYELGLDISRNPSLNEDNILRATRLKKFLRLLVTKVQCETQKHGLQK